MKKVREKTLLALIGALLFLMVSLYGSGASVAAGSGLEPAGKNPGAPELELKALQDEATQKYLGISGKGTFKIEEIKTRVLIIEIFNMYCPHCQREAPRVNELFQLIEGRPDLREKVKLIGIGMGNSPFEVKLFKDKYGVAFPLFPDKEYELTKPLDVKATPTFIGLKKNQDCGYEQIYLKAGAFGEPARFLEEILRLAGLKGE